MINDGNDVCSYTICLFVWLFWFFSSLADIHIECSESWIQINSINWILYYGKCNTDRVVTFNNN